MERKRKAYAPFSQTSEAGVAQTPVEGYIDVNQTIYPTVNTGVVNERGQWSGVKSNDNEFIGLSKNIEVADGATILAPSGPLDKDNYINMNGFTGIFIAVKPSQGGNFAISAVMGPNIESGFANLSPLDASTLLYGNLGQRDPQDLTFLFLEDQIGLAANKWNIYFIEHNLKNQRHLGFKVTNNTGSISDIEFGYMRTV
jgi:hypothetical protein